MKKTLRTLAVPALVLVLGAALASRAAAEDPKAAPQKIGTSEAVMVKATVEAIDPAARTVTLKGPRGKSFTVSVDEKFKGLSGVKVGDEVVATYYEAVAFELKKPGEAVPGKTVKEGVGPGGKGAGKGASGRQVTVVAPIEAIDEAKGTVRLKAPDGKSVEVTARDPKNLKKVKVGDLVEITYTEALAVSIEPASKAPAKN
jgi:hypothetical protein